MEFILDLMGLSAIQRKKLKNLRRKYVHQASYINPDMDPTSAIEVLEIDYLADLNGELRFTSKYHPNGFDPPHLVVRRGQTFGIDVKFSRPFHRELDSLTIHLIWLDVGDESNTYTYSTECKCAASFENAKQSGRWDALLFKIKSDGMWASIVLSPPTDCRIGKFDLLIISTWNTNTHTFKSPIPIYILFNPWYSSDTVFQPGALERNETVLNDVGMIFCGTASSVDSFPWKHQQFEVNILPTVLALVSLVGHVTDDQWTDAVTLIACTAQAVKDIIEIRVDGDYSDGTPPSNWTGSASILNQWYQTKTPVKYGSCLTFSGVLTTAYRALGIPARTVTGYDFGVNADASHTIDFFYTDDFDERKALNQSKPETSWIYHVWCEVWYKSAEFKGWHAISTEAGPSPVEAIRNARIQEPSGTLFFYCGINADVCNWKVRPGRPLKLMTRETNKVGTCILTKANNSNKTLDLTSSYHHADRQSQERVAAANVIRKNITFYDNYEKNHFLKNIKFLLKPTKNVKYGDNINVISILKNFGQVPLEFEVCLQVVSVFFNGLPNELLKHYTESVILRRGATEEVKMVLEYADYFERLVEDWMLKIYASATLHELNHDFLTYHVIRIYKPNIQCKVSPNKPYLNSEAKVTAIFVNPLNSFIRGSICLEEMDTGNIAEMPVELIPPKGKSLACFKIIPRKHGEHHMKLFFTADYFQTQTALSTIVK